MSPLPEAPGGAVFKGAEVRLEDVAKSYGGVHAIERVSLTVRPDEFLTLLGPPGSGRTTTLACVAGFAVPAEGEVFLGGRRVTFDPPFKRNVGMVFQNYALFPHMTVADNLAFPLRMRKLLRAAIAIFVSGTRAATLPKKIWDGIRTEIDPTVAAVSSLLIGVTTLVMAILGLVRWRD